MKDRKKLISVVIAGLLIVTNALAADEQEQPLHILYIGALNVGGRSGGGGSRTNYVYLPGQTLAPEAIYFDYQPNVTNLTEAFLKHYDAVVQVGADSEIGAPQ